MPYSLNAMSVRWIPTSLAGILISTAPLIMLAMARRPDTLALGSEAVLGLLRTAVSRLGMSYLIKPAGAARTATITYINPVIATALGVLVLHEQLGWSGPIGLAVILLSVRLATAGASIESLPVIEPD